MAQDLLRRSVLRVLRAWRGKYLFSDDVLNGLQVRGCWCWLLLPTSVHAAGCAARLISRESARKRPVPPAHCSAPAPVRPALPQATFLRGAGAGANAPNPELEAEYEALGDEELELKCRRSGLTRRGGRAAQVRATAGAGCAAAQRSAAQRPPGCLPGGRLAVHAPARSYALQISRLLALDAYLRGDSGPSGSKQPGAAAQPAAAKSGVAAVGMWAEVVAEEPPAPRSKWEEVAADEPPAPLAELSAPAPPPQSAAAPPDTAGVGAARPDVVDEGRRAWLRQVEVEVMQLREDLEERGLGRQEVDRQAEELRARLLAEDGSRAGGSSSIRAGSSGGAREAPSAEKREWERERGREREGTRDRERESGRNCERKRSRSTEHRRASRSRSPRRHRSRSRDRKRR
jgi:U2-associated protein SR140